MERRVNQANADRPETAQMQEFAAAGKEQDGALRLYCCIGPE